MGPFGLKRNVNGSLIIQNLKGRRLSKEGETSASTNFQNQELKISKTLTVKRNQFFELPVCLTGITSSVIKEASSLEHK